MHIHRIRLKNVMAHGVLTVELGTSGIVVVTGPNGGGKSTIIEAVPVALWGETLRGTPPWREGEAAEVEVLASAPDVYVLRKRSAGGRGVLEWAGEDGELHEFESATKAQEALGHVVGGFNTWRRTHVFSSSDAAGFTLASDGERKRLLEAMLGLERFDLALERCRKDLRQAEVAASTSAGTVAQLAVQVEEAGKRVAQADELLATAQVPDVGPLRAKRDAAVVNRTGAQKELSTLLAQVAEVDTQLRALGREEAQLQAALGEAERRLKALAAGTCGTCGQPISAAVVQAQRVLVDQARQAAEDAKEKARSGVALLEGRQRELNDQIRDLREEESRFRERVVSLDQQILAAGKAERTRLAMEESKRAAEASVTLYREKLQEAEKTAAERRHTVAVLTAAEQVLGLRGVRAHVLGRALSGIEAVANAWLSKIAGPGLQLTLKPYSEKKTGGVTDAINLEISGAGGGYGYRASSGGERRRLDVAILLALAEVAQSAQGLTAGTLFLDEVFDALDEAGVDAVREVLVEMAQDRAVVVVTHSKALIERLPAVQRIVVGESAWRRSS